MILKLKLQEGKKDYEGHGCCRRKGGTQQTATSLCQPHELAQQRTPAERTAGQMPPGPKKLRPREMGQVS